MSDFLDDLTRMYGPLIPIDVYDKAALLDAFEQRLDRKLLVLQNEMTSLRKLVEAALSRGAREA